jgi:hypothetical protein
MDIEAYFRVVDELAAECLNGDVAPQDLIEEPGERAAMVSDCVAFRCSLVDSAEEAKLDGYLQMGFFRDGNRRERLGSFAFCFELQHALELLDAKRQCAPYSREQKLFVGEPGLFEQIRKRENGSPDFEMVDLAAVRPYEGSTICALGHGFGKLVSFLSPGIVSWAKTKFPTIPIYVRLNPYWFQKTKPQRLLTEATLVPANPRWLGDLSLRRGMKEFAAYELHDRSPRESLSEYKDYRMRGIRRLEVYAARRNDGYLSMLVEELPRPDEENGLMVARCVHLDTRDPVGTPLREVVVQHLDLAVNVYCGDDRKSRFAQTMQRGKVQDATFRTHLLRVEGAPLESLFEFCAMFLRSAVLLDEWVSELAAESA